MLLATGRAQEAGEISRSQIEISNRQIDVLPSHAYLHLDLANALFAQRRYDDALRAYQRAEEIDPGLMGQSPLVSWAAGRPEDYAAGMRAVLANRGDSAGIAEVDRLHAAAGPRGVARWAAENSARLNPLAPRWVHRIIASVHFIFAGDLDAALGALESMPFSINSLPYFSSPHFDALRDLPRFRAITDEVGLTAYHAKYLKRAPGADPLAGAHSR